MKYYLMTGSERQWREVSIAEFLKAAQLCGITVWESTVGFGLISQPLRILAKAERAFEI